MSSATGGANDDDAFSGSDETKKSKIIKQIVLNLGYLALVGREY